MTAWSYTQSFDALTPGDLNGQDSWSGHGDYDVQNSVAQGAQGIAVNPSGDVTITRVLPATVDSGSMTIYMRDSADTGAGPQFRIGTALTPDAGRIRFANGDILASGTADETLLAGYSVDTWYLITIEFLSATEFRAKVDAGSFSNTVTYDATVSDPDRISFRTATTSRLQYWDNIASLSVASGHTLLLTGAG